MPAGSRPRGGTRTRAHARHGPAHQPAGPLHRPRPPRRSPRDRPGGDGPGTGGGSPRRAADPDRHGGDPQRRRPPGPLVDGGGRPRDGELPADLVPVLLGAARHRGRAGRGRPRDRRRACPCGLRRGDRSGRPRVLGRRGRGPVRRGRAGGWCRRGPRPRGPCRPRSGGHGRDSCARRGTDAARGDGTCISRRRPECGDRTLERRVGLLRGDAHAPARRHVPSRARRAAPPGGGSSGGMHGPVACGPDREGHRCAAAPAASQGAPRPARADHPDRRALRRQRRRAAGPPQRPLAADRSRVGHRPPRHERRGARRQGRARHRGPPRQQRPGRPRLRPDRVRCPRATDRGHRRPGASTLRPQDRRARRAGDSGGASW